jgi:hypothetical protein
VTLKPFPSYVQVSLGVARTFADDGGYITRLLDTPVEVDPGTRLDRLSFRIFNYDPTLAPPGKTAITCFLPTRNVGYWVDLRQREPERYQAEKERVARSVIDVLERKLPKVALDTEVIDVATPATIVRYTGNWLGSMEGWMMKPGASLRPLPNTLPGLRRFIMAGQWVMPGGGLPSGLITARLAVRAICKQDHVAFVCSEAGAGAGVDGLEGLGPDAT